MLADEVSFNGFLPQSRLSAAMSAPSLPRAAFLDQVLTSALPDQVARRFTFAGGEVAAVCTLSRQRPAAAPQVVILYVATFAPSLEPGLHDFGLDYYEQPVASVEEAAQQLADFTQEQAAQFRASCRPT